MPINASNYGACIQKIAARGRISQQEATDLLSELYDHADTMRRTGVKDPLFEATKDLAGKLHEKAAKDRLDAVRNAAIRTQAWDQILANGGLKNAALSLESRMVAINSKLSRMQAPAEEVAFGLHHRWVSAIDVELGKAGLSKVVQSGALDKEIAAELFKLSQIGPKLPPKPNDLAGKAAWILHGPLYEAAERLKGAGARFDHALEYVTHTSHNPRQMREAGFEEWRKKTEPRLDERTFDDLSPVTELGPRTREQAKTQFMQSVYNALITGVHMTSDHATALMSDDSGYIPPAFEGTRNMAAKYSHQRVLYWKDGESWYNHEKDFGGMTTMLATIHRVLGTAANGTSLMEKFGTNPMASLNLLIRKVKEQYRDSDPEGVIAFNNKVAHLNNVMGRLDGSLNIPTSEAWAQFTGTLRTIESTTMLGNVGLTHLMSLPTTLGTMAPHYGVKRTEIYANLIKSLVEGAGPEEKQQIVSEAGAFAHGTLAHFMAQLKTADTFPGRMSAVAAIFLKATGLNFVLESTQNGLRYLLMHHLGRQVDKPFGDLDPLLQNSMARYGMNEQVWDMMRAVPDLNVFEGRRYITPKDIERIPDAQLDAYRNKEVSALRQAIDERKTAHQEADDREVEWQQARIKRVGDKVASLQQWVADKGASRDKSFKDRLMLGLARIDEIKARIEAIEGATDLIQSLKGLGTQDKIQQFLEDVEGGAESWKVAEKSGKAIEQAANRNLSAGERLGEQRAKAERRIQDLQDRLQEHGELADEKNKADVEWLNNRIQELWDDMSEADQRMKDRIQARADKIKEIEGKLPDQLNALRRKARWELADNYAAFLANAGKVATVAGGAREKAWALGGTRPGTGLGEFARLALQFKCWPIAVVNQILGRELYSQQSGLQKTWNLGLLIGFSTLGGAMRMAIRDAASGSPQRDYGDPKTMLAAVAQGGGIGIWGDYLFGEANRMGGGVLSTLAGPVIGDAAQLANIFFKFRDDAYNLASQKEHHKNGAFGDVWPDLARWTIHHVPGANLIGLKGALDTLFWNHLYNALSPGWYDRINRKLIKDTGRSMVGYSPGSLPPTYPFGLGDKHGFFLSGH